MKTHTHTHKHWSQWTILRWLNNISITTNATTSSGSIARYIYMLLWPFGVWHQCCIAKIQILPLSCGRLDAHQCQWQPPPAPLQPPSLLDHHFQHRCRRRRHHHHDDAPPRPLTASIYIFYTIGIDGDESVCLFTGGTAPRRRRLYDEGTQPKALLDVVGVAIQINMAICRPIVPHAVTKRGHITAPTMLEHRSLAS